MFRAAENKTKTRLIVFAVFIFGIIGGVGLMNLISARTLAPAAGTAKRPSPIETLDKEVGLNDAQRQQVETLLQEHRQQFQEIIKTVQPKLDELKQSSRLRIRAVLNPDQQTRFDDWNRRKDAEREKEKASHK